MPVEGRDAQLVARCLAGEAEAFGELYAAHGLRIRAYLLRSGFSPADADDLTQEVFLRVHKALGTFDAQRGRFSTWLSAIARNVARRRWARRAAPENFDPQLAAETLAAPDNPGGGQLREQLDAVGACVGELPAELAAVVRLRYADSRTTRGIAAAVGLPESTVRLRLREAQQRLQRCLRRKGFVE